MTIDEAIEHAKGVARTCDDGQCAADHMQLAEWLRQARGADKTARWYTAKIRELENRSKALETLIGEKEAENAKLRELCADMLHDAMENVCSKSYWCDKKNWQTCNDKSCGSYLYVERARELGTEA